MATYHAIAVTAHAIRGLLANSCSDPAFSGAQFRLYQAANFQSQPLMDFGVSIYLYRVAFNSSRRSMPPRTDLRGICFKPPVPLDFYFLLTAWAKSADLQLALLGWAVRTIEDTPVLPAGFLNQFAGSVQTASGSERLDVFSANEGVELVGDSLSLQDAMNVWEIAKHNQQPSVPYIARSVLIDSNLVIEEGPPVQTRAFEAAPLAQ
jgi:Pvc16 N-terminal domain